MLSPGSRRLLTLFSAVAIASLTLLGALAMLQGGDTEAIRASLRLSGRISLLLFVPAFAASALASMSAHPAIKKLRARRREVGVTFAANQAAHLVLIGWLLVVGTGRPIPIFVYVLGGMGFALTFAMLATSFPGPAKALGAVRWRRLHWVGMHWLAGIFLFDFLKGSFVSDQPIAYVPYALLLIAAFALRARAAWTSRAAAVSPA